MIEFKGPRRSEGGCSNLATFIGCLFVFMAFFSFLICTVLLKRLPTGSNRSPIFVHRLCGIISAVEFGGLCRHGAEIGLENSST